VMEGTSIAIEIDGEAICLDSVGDDEQEAQENGEMQQIIYSAENGEQLAFNNQEQGREEEPTGNEEDREHSSIIPSREELTEELRNKVAYSEEEAYRLYCDYGHRMALVFERESNTTLQEPKPSVQKIITAQKKV